MLKLFFTLVAVSIASLPAWAADQVAEPVSVFHWWVTGGEKDSINTVRRHMEQQGLVWDGQALVDNDKLTYRQELLRRVTAGDPPMAAQVIGYDVQYWAAQDRLTILDDVAERDSWDDVVPFGVQRLSKYQGHWVATPINLHSTNWLWVNLPAFERLGLEPPDTWADLVDVLDAAQAAGLIPLALGKSHAHQMPLFEAVAAGAGGAEFYRRVFVEHDTAALDPDLLRLIFQRMRTLSHYVGPELQAISWDQANELVRSGRALMQALGSWVISEFNHYGLEPGVDYQCYRFPDTQGVVIFNSDQFVLFKDHPAHRETKNTFASTAMDSVLQRDLNVITGAAPARVDVPKAGFSQCGQQAISEVRIANMRRTLLTSIAMDNVHPEAPLHALANIINQHFIGHMDDEQAVELFKQVIISAAQR